MKNRLNKLKAILATSLFALVLNQFSYSYVDCGVDSCCSNWYIAGSGSVAWHNNTRFNDADDDINFNLKYKTGWGAAASIGYIFALCDPCDPCNLCSPWDLRLEAEFVYRRNRVKSNSVNGDVDFFGILVPGSVAVTGGHNQDSAIMANLILDGPLFCDLSFFVGGGIGASWNRIKANGNVSVLDVPIATFDLSAKKTVFAWQVLAGLSYCICPGISLTAGYRWFATTKPSYGRDFEFRGVKQSHIPMTHSVDLGLRFQF